MLDASGIVHIDGDRFLVAEDELDHLRVFELNRMASSFEFSGQVFNLGDAESDFESLAYDREQGVFYCTGSFGRAYSRRLVSFRIQQQSLQDIQELEVDTQTLVNDNVNIESLSLWQSRLLLGYRSPGRGGKALALLTDSASQHQQLLSFDLAGRTFRDMDCIDPHNYLILAGPEKGKHYDQLAAQLWWWNGDVITPEISRLDLDLSGIRAEGLAIFGDGERIEILIGTDESKIKNATGFDIWYSKAESLQSLLTQQLEKERLSVRIDQSVETGSDSAYSKTGKR